MVDVALDIKWTLVQSTSLSLSLSEKKKVKERKHTEEHQLDNYKGKHIL